LPAIRCAERSIDTGKGAALLRVLDGGREPSVVFTRFRATLDFLGSVASRGGIAHESIDGDLPPPARREAVGRLRRSGGVLLSTEVGSEGLNLQFCRRIVNFDLPWNPMRIEQRIGRVHRIGQDHPVDVVNLCLAGTIEERILSILDERINLFELVVGEVEMILGYLDDERDFPDLVLDAFAHADPEGRERSFERIADALEAAQTRYENVKRFDEAFFRNELGV
jgi:SNF2 family DNA or RNA helicase